jgi:chemotaxis protein histidine kinase CheA
MGLSDEEAKEFVEELIPQIETQIPLIEKELAIPDFHQMERLTHSLKGSATNLGTGGISDLLVECNTYLKTGTDIDIATAYFGYLKHYTQELKEQYA